MSTTTSRIAVPATAAWARHPHLATALAVCMLAFWPTWRSFPPAWLSFREHGFVVALFCGWLIWRDRRRLAGDGRGWPLANVAVVGLSMLWLVAFVLNSQLVHQAVLPLLLLAWLLAAAGWAAFKTALPIAGAFLFAIPVWTVLTRPLQSMTVLVNGVLLKVAGIEAKIDGDHIAIRDGVFWVADGCAGVNYFEIGTLVSVIYALAFLRTWKARGAAVALAAILTIVFNWLRVFGLIVVGELTHMQSPLMKVHGTYGWIIFAAGMVVFFLVVPRIDAMDRRELSKRTSDPDADGAPDEVQRSPRSLALTTALAVIGPLFLLTSTALPPSAPPPRHASGIAPSAEWVVQPVAVGAVGADAASNADSDWRPVYTGADEHRIERWTRGADVVQVDRLLYVQQAQGKELVNSENRIAPDSALAGEDLSAPLDADGRRVRIAAVKTNAGLRLIWYWYHVAGRDTPSENTAKIRELVAFVTRAPAAELVTVSTPCRDEKCTGASQLLYSFVMGRRPGGP